MIARILVLCTGNICRSPMAAALLSRRLGAITVESAGIAALSGHGADPVAVSLMNERGVDISAHRARQLDAWMTASADLVLVMEQFQKRHLERRFASLHGRVYLLGQAPEPSRPADRGVEISDPYRKDRAAFEESLRAIDAGVDSWCSRIAGISVMSSV